MNFPPSPVSNDWLQFPLVQTQATQAQQAPQRYAPPAVHHPHSQPHRQERPDKHTQPARGYKKDISNDPVRSFFADIAHSTLEAIEKGRVDVSKTTRNTRLYSSDAPELVNWRRKSRDFIPSKHQKVIPLEMTTLQGAQYLASTNPTKIISILNFASATQPGGGFLRGAHAQEESIARSSTLYYSLSSDVAKPFYDHHTKDEQDGFYSHAMIYSRNINVVRADSGEWINPYYVDVLTSPAVNAREVRKSFSYRLQAEVESKIQEVMWERMARILALFERQYVKNIVLGCFGTGVFENDFEFVAQAWYNLLMAPGARFSSSFDNIAFAIPDRNTYRRFLAAFQPRQAIHVTH